MNKELLSKKVVADADRRTPVRLHIEKPKVTITPLLDGKRSVIVDLSLTEADARDLAEQIQRYLSNLAGSRTFREAVMVECDGEAHSNPHIDNCSTCLPFWKYIPTCPHCNAKLINSQKSTDDGRTYGYCRTCRKHYSIPEVE